MSVMYNDYDFVIADVSSMVTGKGIWLTFNVLCSQDV